MGGLQIPMIGCENGVASATERPTRANCMDLQRDCESASHRNWPSAMSVNPLLSRIWVASHNLRFVDEVGEVSFGKTWRRPPMHLEASPRPQLIREF